MAYTMDTTLKDLLKDPKVKPILDQYIPGVSNSPMLPMVEGMTLQQIVDLKSKKMKQKLALLLEVRKVLTTEQYQKLIVMKMGRCGKGKGGCGKGTGGCKGKRWGRGGCDKKPCCKGRGGPCRGGRPCPPGGPGKLPAGHI